MTIKEVFPNPTVKQVIFQIKFPNLFYIENKIGEFQITIMDKFPESSLLYRRQLLFADLGTKGKIEDLPQNPSDDFSKKIWQFKSNNGIVLNVMSDSIDITSTSHKTYNNSGGAAKFRDLIESVISSFLKITNIPKLTRVGLRYTDECPLPKNDNSTYDKYYNGGFNTKRFDLNKAQAINFSTTLKRGAHYLTYKENLKMGGAGENCILNLDFDGVAVNIDSKEYLKVADELHSLIADEFEATIKDPVYEHMRKAN